MLNELLRIVFDSGFEVSERIPYDFHNRIGVYPMTGTAIGSHRLLAVLGAYILCDLLSIARPVTVHEAPAIMADHFPVKRMRFSPTVRITLNARPAFLRIIECLLVNDRLLRIFKDLPVFLCHIMALLILKMLSGLKVYRMSQIFLSREYRSYA